ncbi:diguanylate cyclase (GGDEF)-like protein [Rhizobium sp. PP-F2F-G38]|nr:diguanylate cyclase (GGDEF)-like protein [Rhizobium sp. PP-F2F-G38]
MPRCESGSLPPLDAFVRPGANEAPPLARLTELAARDPLTGLFNRRHLDATLREFSTDRNATGLVCIMIDIDHFKRFNDEFGHDAGDIIMRCVGQILRDTSDQGTTAYRFGGEEFTLLLPDRTEQEGFELAERLRQRISQATLSHAGRMLGTVTVSLGVASAPQEGSVETLVTRAETALSMAKSKGRDQTLVASTL